MRDPLQRLSVKYKIALLVVGLCLLAFGVGGFLVSRSARNALESEIVTRLEFQTRACANALDARLALLASRAEDFASDGHIRRLAAEILAKGIVATGVPAKENAPQRRELRAELARHLAVNKLPLVPSFRTLTIVAADGRDLVRPAPAPEVASFLAANEGAAETFYGDVLPGAEPGAETMLIGTPLRRLDGNEVFGALVVHVSVRGWVDGALAAAKMSPAATEGIRMSLVDGSGRRLLVSRQSTPAARGYSRVFRVSSNDWTLRIDLREGRMLDAVAALQSRILAFALVLAAAALLSLYFPMRYLVRPLLELKAAAGRIGSGDFATRVAVSTGDELGELGGSFNAMAAALQERDEALRAHERELSDEHAKVSAVIASMRDGLVVLDAGGEVVLSNTAAAPFLERADVAAVAPHSICRFRETSAPESCWSCTFDASRAPQSCVIHVDDTVYEIHATPLPSAGGVPGRVLVVRDITGRLHEDEVQIHQERLAVLGEVAAVMAHELNNPLTAISMFGQMLGTALPEDSALQENVQVIRRNTDACKQTIRELLDYATGATPELAPIDVHDVLEDVVRFLQPISQRSAIRIRLARGAPQATVGGDEVQIRQVFVNLVMNAVQAMRPRGGAAHGAVIELVTAQEDGCLVVDVIDDGPGVDEAVRDRIFRPFFTSKSRGEGTGLGLSTAERIAELHGGGLSLVESGPGRTVFRVRFRGVTVQPMLETGS